MLKSLRPGPSTCGSELPKIFWSLFPYQRQISEAVDYIEEIRYQSKEVEHSVSRRRLN